MPLYSALGQPLYMISVVLLAIKGFHACIVPSSVENRKRPGFPATISKSGVLLNTMPSGLPPGDLSHWGMSTISDCLLPARSYSVDLPVWLSETHQKPVGLGTMPHGLTRSLSVGALPTFGISD